MRKRPWLDHYDYWVPHHTNYPRRPLYEILRRAAAEGGELPATTFLGQDLTFAEIKQSTAAARAGHFQYQCHSELAPAAHEVEPAGPARATELRALRS